MTVDYKAFYSCNTILDTREDEYRWCMNYIKSSGICLEFGVYKGHSINFCANLRPDLSFFGFDSFEGLPEEWNLNSTTKIPKGYFSTNPPKVKPNVTLVKGWFEETVSKFSYSNKEDIIFLNIDCDLYSSTRIVLFELNKFIKPGTIVRFDELLNNRDDLPYSEWEKHEWRAFQEWISKCNRKVEIKNIGRLQGATVEIIV